MSAIYLPYLRCLPPPLQWLVIITKHYKGQSSLQTAKHVIHYDSTSLVTRPNAKVKSRGSSRQSLGHRPALLGHPSANGRENVKRRPLAGQSGLVIHIGNSSTARQAPMQAPHPTVLGIHWRRQPRRVALFWYLFLLWYLSSYSTHSFRRCRARRPLLHRPHPETGTLLLDRDRAQAHQHNQFNDPTNGSYTFPFRYLKTFTLEIRHLVRFVYLIGERAILIMTLYVDPHAIRELRLQLCKQAHRAVAQTPPFRSGGTVIFVDVVLAVPF